MQTFEITVESGALVATYRMNATNEQNADIEAFQRFERDVSDDVAAEASITSRRVIS